MGPTECARRRPLASVAKPKFDGQRAPQAYDAGAVSAGAFVSRALPKGSVGASALASANSESSKGAAICDPPASPLFVTSFHEYRLERRVGSHRA